MVSKRERRSPEPKLERVTISTLTLLSPNTDATVDFPEGSIRVGPVYDVINAAGEYAVFVDDRGRIRYITAPSHELESPNEFNAEWNHITRLEFSVDQLQDTHSSRHLATLRDMIGHAVGIGLENDMPGMTAGLAQVEELLVGMVQRNARRVYAATAKRAALVMIGVAVLIFLGEQALLSFPSLSGFPELRWLDVVFTGILGGSAGALLSILTATTRDVPFDPLSSADYARFEARTRILIGALSGMIVALANKTGVISSSLTNVEPATAGMVLLAVVAGFVERLVPSLLTSQASAAGAGDEQATKPEGTAKPEDKPAPTPEAAPESPVVSPPVKVLGRAAGAPDSATS